MSREQVPANPRDKADWLLGLDTDGDAARRDALLSILRAVGLWLHPQGRLEQVLGIPSKGGDMAKNAAAVAGDIDAVTAWAAYALDQQGEVKLLLDVAVERSAHSLMEAMRLDPSATFTAPVGSTAESDAQLVRVEPGEAGCHRLTVLTPRSFAGWWLEFSRETPSTQLDLKAPELDVV